MSGDNQAMVEWKFKGDVLMRSRRSTSVPLYSVPLQYTIFLPKSVRMTFLLKDGRELDTDHLPFCEELWVTGVRLPKWLRDAKNQEILSALGSRKAS